MVSKVWSCESPSLIRLQRTRTTTSTSTRCCRECWTIWFQRAKAVRYPRPPKTTFGVLSIDLVFWALILVTELVPEPITQAAELVWINMLCGRTALITATAKFMRANVKELSQDPTIPVYTLFVQMSKIRLKKQQVWHKCMWQMLDLMSVSLSTQAAFETTCAFVDEGYHSRCAFADSLRQSGAWRTAQPK